MKKIYSLVLLCLATVNGLWAQVLLEENFNYGSTPGDISTVSAGAWATHSGTGGPVNYVKENLSMMGYYPQSALGGAAQVAPYSNTVLDFDGQSSNDYVETSAYPSISYSNNLTIEAWIYPRSYANQKVISKSGWGGNGFVFGLNNGYLYPEFWDNWGSNYTFQAGALNMNAWNHVAITWETNGSLKAYINGSEVYSISTGSQALSYNSYYPVRIGGSPWNNNEYKFDGKFDDIRIWNVTRSASDISTNMTSCLTGTEPGLMALYNFEDGVGSSIVSDLTANNNDLTLQSGMDASSDWMASITGGCAPVTNTKDVNRSFTSQNSGTVYSSALINVSSAGVAEDYFMHFLKGTSSFYSRVFLKDDGMGGFNIGIKEQAEAAVVYAPGSYSYNTSYILVTKYDFTDGSASLYMLNSEVSLEPAPDAYSNGGTNATDFAAIAFRQGSTAANVPNVKVDGLKVSLSWADIFPAPAKAGFDCAFAPGNWNFSSTSAGGDGSVDEGGAPYSIVLYGANNDAGGGYEQYSIIMSSSGNISFDYNHSNVDIDDAYYFINGVETFITSSGSGTLSNIYVNAGDEFGFRVKNYDNCCGGGVLTVTNFSFAPSICSYAYVNNASSSICAGASNGYIDLAVAGDGSGCYSFLWSNGATTEDLSNLEVGTYSVVYVDENNGCSNSVEYTINATGTPVNWCGWGCNQNDADCNDENGYIELYPTQDGAYYWDFTYDWGQGPKQYWDGGSSIYNLSGGTYTVTLTNNYTGCTSSNTYNVGSGIFDITVTSTESTCGNSDGTASVAASGNGAPFYTEWNTGSTDENLTGLAAGAYIVTVTNDYGCTLVDGAAVSDDGAPVLITSKQDVMCFNAGTGSVSAVVTGGVGPYNYLWSNGATTSSINNLDGGIYSLTVTDSQPIACKVTGGEMINEPNSALQSYIDSYDDVSCYGESDGAIWTYAYDGTDPYTYLWSNGETSQNIYDLGAGTYTLTVTDANGCTKVLSQQIDAPSSPISVNVNVTHDICGTGDGSLFAQASGGNGPQFNYIWNGNWVQSYNDLYPGTYSLEVYDDNWCYFYYGDVNVNGPSSSIYVNSITATDADCGQSNGAVGVEVGGGTTPYSYLWSNGATTTSQVDIAAGAYLVTVFDANGCDEWTGIAVNNPGAPSFDNITWQDESCAGAEDGSAEVFVSGGITPYTYSWTNADGFPVGNTSAVSGLAKGLHLITVADAQVPSCQVVEGVFINGNDPLVLVLDQNYTPNCSGESGYFDIHAEGGNGSYSFAWSDGPTGEDRWWNVYGGTDYTVTVTDGNGCTAEETYAVPDAGPYVVDITVVNDTCGLATGAVEINVSGGTMNGYNIYPGFDNWIYGVDNVVGTDLWSSTYYYTIYSTSWSCYYSGSYIIGGTTNGGNLYADVNWTDVSICGGSDGSVQITGVGGGNGDYSNYTYVWYDNTNTLISTETTVTGLTAGVYFGTVTDEIGCTSDFGAPVNEVGAPVISGVYTQDVNCSGGNDGEAYVDVSGGVTPYTYTWFNTESGLPAGTTQTITGLTEGFYLVTVTGGGNCNAYYGNNVGAPDVMEVNFWDSEINCYGEDNGQVGIDWVNGGVWPYSYEWSTGSTNDWIDNLMAGTYTVTVTDDNGCTSVASYELTQPEMFDVSVVTTNVSCFGGNNGSATATVTGANGGGYNLSWSNGGNQLVKNNLAPGVYVVNASDNWYGCFDSETITITQPSAITVTTSSSTNQICATPGTASVSAAGGISPYTYLWSNSATDAVASLNANTYNVVVTDANGCTKSKVQTVGLTIATVNVALNITDDNCGTNDGAIDVTASGAYTPYTYSWSNSSTTEDLSGLSGGSYEVTVTDMYGCSGVESTSLNGNPMMILSMTATDATCGSSDGTVTTEVTGGDNSYTYLWSNGETTADLGGVFAGTISLTVTDGNGCTVSDATAVSNAGAPSLSTMSDATSCFNGMDGSAMVMVSGGSTPYTYMWSNGSTDDSANGLAAGTHYVTVTDAQPCLAVVAIAVSQPTQLILNPTSTTALCFGDVASTFVTANGGTTPYSYLWANGNTADGGGMQTVGTYAVTVTDGNSCSAAAAATVTEPAQLTATLTDTDVLCNGGNSGSIASSVSGGVTPYTYLWSNGAATANTSGLVAGTYTLSVTDANGCEIFIFKTVDQPSAVVINSITSSNVTCFGGNNGSASVTYVGGTSPYSAIWSNGSTLNSVLGLTSGTYSVTITDNNGCKASGSTSVAQPANIAATTAQTPEHCGSMDGTISVASISGGQSPYTFAWSFGGSNMVETGLASGNYNVTITDNAGCTKVALQSVGASNPTINVNTTPVDDICNNGSGAMIANANGGTAPYTYMWSNGGTADLVNGVSVGTYSVTATDSYGCFGVGSVTIDGLPLLVGAITTTDASCGVADGSASVVVSGGTSPYDFSWSTAETTEMISNLDAGLYSVTIVDDNNCVSEAFAAVANAGAPSITVTAVDALCFGSADGEVSVSAEGGLTPYNYAWYDSNNNLIGTDVSVSGLTAGTYGLELTDSQMPNACLAVAFVEVSEPVGLGYTLDAVAASCNGSADGSITAIITDGTAPYTYLWSDASTDDVASGLIGGSYTVTVTDNNGCSLIAYSEVTQPDALSGTLTIADLSCNGSFDGSADFVVTGGTEPYSYLWSDASTDASVSGMSAGAISVTVTDANGCEVSANGLFTQPDALSLTITSTDALCFGGNDGTAEVSTEGGSSPYSYEWSNSEVVASVSDLIAGTYTVTVMDNNGCSISEEVTIGEASEISLVAVSTDVTCGQADGSASVNTFGGTGNFSFVWSNDETSSSIYNLFSGTYSVTATDENGCSEVASVDVVNPNAPAATASESTPVSCFGGNDGSAEVSATGGNTPYSYEWSNGDVTSLASGFEAGEAFVTVTDVDGCAAVTSVMISEPSQIIATVNVTSPTTLGGADGYANVTVSGGNGPFTYLWSDNSTDDNTSGLSQGTYSVEVFDIVPTCSVVAEFDVVDPTCILAITGTSTNESADGASDGTAMVTVDSGTPSYSYEWSNGETTDAISGLTSGFYTVTVMDAMGCSEETMVAVNYPGGCVIALSIAGTDAATIGGNEGSAVSTIIGGTPAFNYTWSDGQTDADAVGLMAGTYTLTVTDGSACVVIEEVVIAEPSCDIVLTMNSSDATTVGGNDGSADVSVSGAQGATYYAWSSGGTDASISGLTQGVYTVTVSDDVNCVVTETVSIAEPTCTIAVTVLPTDASFGVNDGSVSASVSGSVGTLSYVWSNNATDAFVQNLAPGTYDVTVTEDNTLCVATGSAVVGEVAPTCDITVTASFTDPSVNGASDGDASVVVTGDQGNLTYAWSNGGTDASISGLAAGVYEVTVSDDVLVGCSVIESVTLTDPAVVCNVAVTIAGTDATTPGGSDGSAVATVTGATGIVEYAWSNGETTASVSNLSEGNYTLTVTDANMCTATASVSISDPTSVEEIASSMEVILYPNPTNGTVFVKANKGIETVELFDMTGRVIVSRTEELNKSLVELNMDNYESGVYFVRVSSGNQVQTLRVTKN